jgi:hypothetical protein
MSDSSSALDASLCSFLTSGFCSSAGFSLFSSGADSASFGTLIGKKDKLKIIPL